MNLLRKRQNVQANRGLRMSCWLFAALLTTALGPASQAQGAGVYVYTVSFECGFQASADGSQDYEPVAKVANYALKVDLLNADPMDATVDLVVHDDTTVHFGSSLPPVSTSSATIPANAASLVDCTDLLTALLGGSPKPPGKPFYSGLVSLRSDRPLIVWATKTTEVCAGLVQVSQAAHLDPDILVFDENGVLIPAGTPLPPAAPILFGCPPARAFHSRYGADAVPPGPGGGVPPGLRSVNVVEPLGDRETAYDLSVSHSIDFERVEGVFIPLP